jgi:hypothetical protein
MLLCTIKITEDNVGCNGTVIRYNISQNDKERIFQVNHNVRNAKIYNNVIYVKEGIDVPLVSFAGGKNGWADNFHFYNNIFYADGKLHYSRVAKWLGEGRHEYAPGFGKCTNIVFSNNVFYGNHIKPPHDPGAITSDPMLVNPGSGGNGFTSLDGYKLKADSPCIGAGNSIAETGVLDFWANKINKNKPCIGVHEKVN